MSNIRITAAHVDSTIKRVIYLQPSGTTLTLCIMELRNGTYVTGESACVDPENFNKDIGERIAHENAKEKIWSLEGYLLKQSFYEEQQKL